ncbi:MAG: sulfite exporter TauE/SafE family protein [Verrucomicrobiota bacterium]
MEQWMLYILAGILAGIISSLFGIGAGVLLVPILAIGFGFAQKSAQGMALFVMLPMALTGAIRYYLNPDIQIDLPICGLIAAGGVIGALLGSQLVFFIPNAILKPLFACLLILVGINMLVKSIRQTPVKEPLCVESNR